MLETTALGAALVGTLEMSCITYHSSEKWMMIINMFQLGKPKE